MKNLSTMYTGVTHQLYRGLLVAAGRADRTEEADERDRGAVSLEQVLWFVAAGIMVAAIATILWRTIKSEAEKPIEQFDEPDT
jgi:hypothetical protein